MTAPGGSAKRPGRAILCEDVGGPNRRCIPIELRRPECDPQCAEHRSPSNYVQALEWQEFMAETHVQRQCPGCGLWTIWEPRASGPA